MIPNRRRSAAGPAFPLLPLILAAAAVLAAAAPPAAAQPDPAATAWGAAPYDTGEEPSFPDLPPGAEVLRLDNGLQALLLPNPAQKMVGVFTQVRVGSVYESFRTSGTSHMLEHLLFNGTEKYDQESLYDLADSLGAYNNAHTTGHFTNFMVILPSRSLAAGLDLQSQMLFHSTIPPEKFEKERGIVLGELAQSGNRGGVFADEALREALYAGTSRRLPVLGTAATIAEMSRDEVAGFYRNFYVPNNMITTIAGGFDRDEAVSALEEFFGPVAPGDVARPEITPPPFIDRTRTVTRRGGGDHVLSLAWEAPGYGSPDFFPFLALSLMLDSPTDGILTRAIDEMPADRRPQLSTWWDRAEGAGRLIVQLTLPDGEEPEVYHRMVRTALGRALEWGVESARVAAVVKSETTETLIEREQLRHMAVMAAEPLVQGGVDHFLNYLHDLAEVRVDEVARVLGAYLVDSPHLVLHVTPRAGADSGPRDMPAGMPPGMGGMGKMMGGKASAGMAADGGPRTEAAGTPSPAAAAEPVVERSVLANGSVLVTLTNPGSRIFAAHLTSRARAAVDGDRPGAVNLVHRLLTSGIGGCDRDCVAGKLSALGARLKTVDDPRIPMDDYTTSGRFAYVRLETAAQDGPEALALLLDMIQHGSFTPEDLERERGDQLALLRRDAISARDRADRLLARELYGDHPLAADPSGDAATVAAADYDDLRRVYRREFAPANLIFAVASPLPHERIAGLIEGMLPAREEIEPALPPLEPTDGSRRVAETVGADLAAVRIASVVGIDPADAPALDLLAALLSDRLGRDLRETRGLAYSVGATIGTHGAEAVLRAWINPPADRLAEAEPALLSAVRGFDPATITAAELDRIRSARVGRLMMRRLSSIGQAYYMAMAELDGDLAEYTDVFDRYEEVTVGELRSLWARYLAGAEFVAVVVD